MEFIGEFIFEMIFEGASEAIGSRRIPKYVRYPLTALVILFVTAVIGGVIIAGVLIAKDTPVCGLMLIAFGIFMAVLAAKRFTAELRSVSK